MKLPPNNQFYYMNEQLSLNKFMQSQSYALFFVIAMKRSMVPFITALQLFLLLPFLQTSGFVTETICTLLGYSGLFWDQKKPFKIQANCRISLVRMKYLHLIIQNITKNRATQLLPQDAHKRKGKPDGSLWYTTLTVEE